jgi:predicted dehydrogenase
MEIPPLLIYRNGQTSAIDDIRDDWGDSFHDSGWDFIDSILQNRTPILSGEEGRALMQFWLAIKRSYEEGREICLAEIT